jgi:hypothetical protein
MILVPQSKCVFGFFNHANAAFDWGSVVTVIRRIHLHRLKKDKNLFFTPFKKAEIFFFAEGNISFFPNKKRRSPAN